MRIADKMQFNQVINNLSRNRTKLSELQNQAATQKRVTKPSDDPVAASRVLAARVDTLGNTQYQKSLDYARSFLEYTDQSLGELTEYLARAKELALSQVNDASANQESRKVTATEIGQVYGQLVQVGNRKLGDRYVFGGFRTQQKPFDTVGNYRGDSNEMMLQVDKGAFVAVNIPGSKVFSGEGVSADGISHATTIQPESIEEFLGEQQQNKIDKETQQQLNKEIEAQLRGPASVSESDEPATTNVYGELTNEAGGINIFDVVRKMEVALKTNDKVGLQDTLERLDKAFQQVVLARSQVGSRVMVLDNAMESLQKSKVDSQVMASALEDADIFNVVSDINRNESQLQATMQTAGKLVPKSLLDFVR